MPKHPTRPQRWNEALSRARKLFDEAEALKSQLDDTLQAVVDALTDVASVQEEYNEWREKMPESMQGTATAELLDAIIELDLAPAADDMEEIGTAIENAEGVELPRGFGRD